MKKRNNQANPPQRLPKSKSLATYEEWKRHERQQRRSQSFTGSLQGEGKQNGGDKSGTASPRKKDKSSKASSENGDGTLSETSERNAIIGHDGITEYATLELRIHPPNVRIDNTLDENATVVIIDSANRPGTLVEVVQNLTELGLDVVRAQISSDGGWFVDVFHVTDIEGKKIVNKRLISRIENILDLSFNISPGVPCGTHLVGVNVIEILARDKPGLLSELSQVVSKEGNLNIFDTLLWTYDGYAAVLFTASVSGKPVSEERDLLALQAAVEKLFGDDEKSFVNVDVCYDTICLEKRFYRLKVRSLRTLDGDIVTHDRDEEKAYSEKLSVSTLFEPETGYTILNISSRDRPQLLFDTVCTLSDLGIDVYHATVDTSSSLANLEFYIRKSSGAEINSDSDIIRIKKTLGKILSLGAPPVLCLQVLKDDIKGMLAVLCRKLFESNLNISYCTVRTDPIENKTCSVFYVIDAPSGRIVGCDARVQRCCDVIGAKCIGGVFHHQKVKSVPDASKDYNILDEWNKSWLGV